jgi:uncharacterized protein (TIGR03067 family)
MTRISAAGCLMVLSTIGVLFADEKDQKELDGTYSVLTMQKGAEVAKKEMNQRMKIVFKGESLAIVLSDDGKKDEKTAKIKLDTTKQPHSIDITPTDGPEKGKTFPGIYKYEKGELTLAFTEKQGADRPKDFKSDENVILLKLKKD